ncbi:1,4-dihydroxy-2-naphthoate polyprenyltransferase [Jatrophihabitans endophyticus]|uniref:1,4-dihydroxy-2-naphthoate polyprenyltransferase n=1 Tax=Jatrophihabitans endophyticus TaxID=1206085 RepID=UPI001A043E28|nr:1,4-dihydroxy-2-naphthoate polyprenyltransferase [Jatrophihabitans endophyticus]MBE7186970.1 1,4-dihydroxy-2-naphthoate polyprenyltransferase [Jatrophihabitans endophyticus]
MATLAQWLEGARPRTLFLALSPVVAGTGVAAYDASPVWGRAALALIVALALQVGVNFANDYSDGVRGTDADRVGPLRLVGSGAARPRAVLGAALACFVVAAAAGVVLAASASWWLLLVGALAIAAAWFYTGGGRPYGYRGLGELAVFVFFGLVAVGGTAYVQTGRITGTTVLVAVPVGLLACAVLVANNLRDIPGDERAGKRTLAVLLGDRGTRWLYEVLVVVPFVFVLVLGDTGHGPPFIALAAAPLALGAATPVHTGATGRDLIPTLRNTGLLSLAFAVLLAVGVGIAS